MAVEAARAALGRSSPRAPSAAVLEAADGRRAVVSSEPGRGALAVLLGERGQALGDRLAGRLHLVVEPEPVEAEALVRAADPEGLLVDIARLDPGLGGRGLARLLDAGVRVHRSGWGPLEPELERLLGPAEAALRRGRVDVLLKTASSLDGRVATHAGESQWITSPEARARGRALRGEVDLIVAGLGTVVADDPQLTTRIEGRPDPVRVVVDSRARTPLNARVVRTAQSTPTYLATTAAADPEACAALSARGVQVERLPEDARGRVDLRALLARLFALGYRTALVEGGPRLVGSLVDRRLVDRVAWFVAPSIIGGEGALAAVLGRGAGRLQDAARLEQVEVERCGVDLLVRGVVSDHPDRSA